MPFLIRLQTLCLWLWWNTDNPHVLGKYCIGFRGVVKVCQWALAHAAVSALLASWQWKPRKLTVSRLLSIYIPRGAESLTGTAASIILEFRLILLISTCCCILLTWYISCSFLTSVHKHRFWGEIWLISFALPFWGLSILTSHGFVVVCVCLCVCVCVCCLFVFHWMKASGDQQGAFS